MIFLKKHWFGLCMLFILTLATFFRFYNYENRWSLASDQARDALVARESLRQYKIPMIGPFSSAGNFTTGPIWYWWLALSTSIYPHSVLTPWIVSTIFYVVIVYVMILIGKDLGGRQFAIIAGLLTAVSPAQIAQSVNLTNPSLVALFSTCALYFAVRYLNSGRNIFLFFFPFFIAQAINTHYQSVYLLLLIPPILLMKKPDIRGLFFLTIGIIIPFIPYMIFDVQNNFYNTRGIIDFILYGQYKIYIPNRWLTYAGIFWPNMWAKIIGGMDVIGYITIAVLSIIAVYTFVKRKTTKQALAIIISFLLMFISLRYYRGERFGGYFVFIHPFVLILTAWVCYELVRLKRFVGLSFIIILMIGSIDFDVKEIKNATNYASIQAEQRVNFLSEKYPGKKFAVYSVENALSGLSLPFVLYLDQSNKTQDNGYKIGFGNPSRIEKLNIEKLYHKVIKDKKFGYEFWDLNGSTSAQLEKAGWGSINPSSVYHSTVEWYIDK